MRNIFKNGLVLLSAILFASTMCFAKDPSATLDVEAEAKGNAFYSLDALPAIKNLDWVGYNSTGSGSGGCISESHWKLSNSRTITFKVKNCSKVEAVDSYFSKDATTNLKYSINGSAAVSFATNGNNKKTCATGEFNTNNSGEITIVLSADNDVALNEIRFYTAAAAGPSTDATLKSLTYNGTSVTGFSADKTNYDVELAAGTTQVPTVAAEANDSKATAVVTQATQLPGTAKVNVTAEDGTTKSEYTVTFTVASAAPKVTKATWANILGTATIDQVNGTITGQVTNGSSLTLTPQFEGNNIATWTPQGAQDFSAGAVTYFFTSPTSEATTYTLTITEAPPMSSDATLKSLTVEGCTIDFSPTQLSYNIEVASGSTVPSVSYQLNDTKAQATKTDAANIPGVTKIEVKAEDGTTLTYTINFTIAVPSCTLAIHQPEIYEAKTIAGGYEGKLSVFGGREYEVYYFTKLNDAIAVCTQPISGNIAVNSTKKTFEVSDQWITGTCNDEVEGGTSTPKDDAPGSGEFNACYGALKMGQPAEVTFHISGFDEFAIYAYDNNTTLNDGKKRWIDVYIDDMTNPVTIGIAKNPATIRRYSISTGEHVVKLKSEYGGSKLYGISLRVAKEPRTKWVRGEMEQSVKQTQNIKNVTLFTKYNSMGMTKIVWEGDEATGIGLQKGNSNELGDTLILGGQAKCPTGEYKFRVVSLYNGQETSSVSGKLTVTSEIIAAGRTQVTGYQNEDIDPIQFRYYALSENDITLTWKNGNEPEGISGSGRDGKYTISGIPTTTGEFIYTVSVKGGNSIEDTIRVKVLDMGNDPVLYLYKNDGMPERDGVYKYLTDHGRNLIERKTKEEGLRPADQLEKYKWILISEDADATNPEVQAILRGEANLPVLNMQAYAYNPGRMEWGEASSASVSDNGKSITVQRADHPIFQAMGKKQGDKIQVLDSIAIRGLMTISVRYDSTLCLATALTRDKTDYHQDGLTEETFIHEIPASLRGGKKYICLPIAMNSTNELSAEGKQLLDETVKYLLGSKPTVSFAKLEITSFSLGTHKGAIDQDNNTITITIDESEGIDLTQAQPVVTLASTQSHVTPNSGETVDLSDDYFGLDYVVSDYIHRRVYNVVVKVNRKQGIDEIRDAYTVGDWVNIYDIQGRKLTTTNEDIYQMALPAGVYIISTAKGTFKITR